MPVEVIEIYDLFLVTESAKAYLIRTLEDAEHWIPKSQVSYIDIGNTVDSEHNRPAVKEITRMEIPLWLAEKNGLA